MTFKAAAAAAVPLQAWSGPEYSKEVKVPTFTTTAQDGGKVKYDIYTSSIP